MASIRQIHDWRTSTRLAGSYETLLHASGTDAFGPAVLDAVGAVTAGAQRMFLFEATSRDSSSLHYFYCEPGLEALFPVYRRCFLSRDPVGEGYRAAPRAADMVLMRIGPRDIPSPGFRRRFFDDPGIVERISIIQRGADAWRVMNVARHRSHGIPADEELSALIGLAGLVLPMLPLQTRRRPAPLSVAQLEERFAMLHGELTPRERQVCARAAAGISVADTARQLGIAPTSVLTYRQRAYQRLQVASPVELSTLVTH